MDDCRFQRFVVVDWSAAGVPRTGRDSIWIGVTSVDGSYERWNARTRAEASGLIEVLLTDSVRRGIPTIVGWDFGFGYPLGFAESLGIEPRWDAVWDEIAARIVDRKDNSNNRFEAAAAWNRRIGTRQFWGCPASRAGEWLSVRRTGEGRLNEWRESERANRGTQPVWKLAYAGSVGSQSLTGIPVVRALRFGKLRDCSRVWPFEEAGDGIVHVEVWPSRVGGVPRPGEVRDEMQVREFGAWMARQDHRRLLERPLPAAALMEGWIL